MKILVSACLIGENCKYNGGNNKSEKLIEYLKDHEVVSVCPEVLGGLPIPRIPCEIVNGIVTNKNGISCDHEFRKGAEIAFQITKEQKIDLAILQSRSPSCGIKQIYSGEFNKTLINGSGVFAKKLIENNIKVIDLEDFENELE